MKLVLTLFAEPPANPTAAAVRKLNGRIHQVLRAYNPRQDKDKDQFEIEFPAEDVAKVNALVKPLAKALLATKQMACITVSPDPGELTRARFVPLVCFSEANEDTPNPLPQVLCKACRFPDVSRPPNRYVIAMPPAMSAEMISTSNGVLIVRPRVLELLRGTVGAQIEAGEVQVKGKSKPVPEDRLHWVRPRHRVGNLLGKALSNPCPVCKRPLESRRGGSDDEIDTDFGPRLEHFGQGKADIALIDGYFGCVRNGEPSWYWSIAVSGALFTHLKKSGVRGISTAPGGDPPKCYFSAKREPTFEKQPRTFEQAAAPTKPAGDSKLVSSFKNVPWDRDKKGDVYLYLTTPQLVVIDPMTFEEDSGGPYKLKNFKPGLHRMPMSAIKPAKGKRGVAVDSASLLLIDGAFFADLQEAFEWDKSNKSNGSLNKTYLDKVAKQIGNRFGLCSIEGDGEWMIDVSKVERVT